MTFFKKLACFTDIHFGLKGDARRHNRDCEEFIDWFIAEAKEYGAETCIFLGDWHHNRARIDVSTLNYTISNVEKLGQAFENFYFITGNHDLFYREKREINSVEFGRNVENVTIVSDIIHRDEVAIVPWLVGEEWKDVCKLPCRYMFGHFELPNFKMNQMVEMPDTGALKATDFIFPEYVFSGHFHKRQQKGNVIYIGNAFPHNFADVGDDERGAMFMEWGGTPEYKKWPDAPNYHRLPFQQFIEEADLRFNERSYIRVDLNKNISYEEAQYAKEIIKEHIDPRDIQLMPFTDTDHTTDWGGEIDFESVDSVVYSHIDTIRSPSISNELLAAIYRNL